MKKSNLLTIIISSLFFFNSSAQWIEKPSGTSNHLYDVHFPSSTTGYAAGYNGTILKSTDTGETWATLTTNTSLNLESIYFVSDDKGFAVGDSIMLRTDDGGVNWNPVTLPVFNYFVDVEFIDDLTGFCVGHDGIMLKTIDGGSNWVAKNSGTTQRLSSIQFPTPNVGYAVTTGYSWSFLKTIDAGETWSTIAIGPINNLSNFETVHFTSENVGVIGGWYIGALIKTEDGGNTWSEVTSSGGTVNMYSLHFPSPLIGYGVGWSGEAYRTEDGGTTWTMETLSDNTRMTAVFFVNDVLGIAVGDAGKIIKTTNGAVSIHENKKNEQFSLYPNPTKDKFTLTHMDHQYAGQFELRISNLIGEVVYLSILSGWKNQIDVSELKSGSYFLHLGNDKFSSRQQWIKL